MMANKMFWDFADDVSELNAEQVKLISKRLKQKRKNKLPIKGTGKYTVLLSYQKDKSMSSGYVGIINFEGLDHAGFQKILSKFVDNMASTHKNGIVYMYPELKMKKAQKGNKNGRTLRFKATRDNADKVVSILMRAGFSISEPRNYEGPSFEDLP